MTAYNGVPVRGGSTFVDHERTQVEPEGNEGAVRRRPWITELDLTDHARANRTIRSIQDGPAGAERPSVIDGNASRVALGMPAVGYVCAPDETWSCNYVTPQISTILGFTAQAWCDDRDLWLDCIHPEDRTRVVSERLRAVELGRPFTSDYRMQSRDGRTIHVHDCAVPPTAEDPAQITGVFVDVTAEEHSHDVVRRRGETLRSEVTRMRVNEEARDGFVQLFVHDVRAAMTGAAGLARTLRAGRLEGPAADDALDRIVAGLDHVRQLTEQILDLSRLRGGQIPLCPVPVELTALLRRAVEEANLFDRITYFQPPPVLAVVDTVVAQRVITNLVANAVRHAPEGTAVRVRVLQVDRGVLVVVEDEGDGVPEEWRERVFEPFVRVDDDDDDGLGLGLPLARRLVELHGGRIWIEDGPGGGAAFHVLFPQDGVASAV